MTITLFCNAGLAIQSKESVLYVDLPNSGIAPFNRLSEHNWQQICEEASVKQHVAGFVFTHEHPDHLDRDRLKMFPDHTVPIFIPDEKTPEEGRLVLDAFCVSYKKIDHAPIPNAPEHRVLVIEAENKAVYIAADADLDCSAHRSFLGDRLVDAAFWNSMYLSRSETRQLLAETAKKNYIYHMPVKPDAFGLWKKCEKNFQRYSQELINVVVAEGYPTTWEV